MPDLKNSRLEKNINETIAIISRYVNSCATHAVPDYYQIFQLNHGKNDYAKHKKKLEKAFLLFHPDNLALFEKAVQDPIVVEYFKEISESMLGIIETMTVPAAKMEYDAKLKEEYDESKEYCKAILEVLNTNSGEKFNEVAQFEEIKKEGIQNTYESLAKVIGTNISKYGTEYGIKALLLYFTTGDIKGFTREESSREIMQSLDIKKVINDLRLFWESNDPKEVAKKTVNLILNEKLFNLFKASILTFYKYGRSQLEAALSELASEYPSYDKFTNVLGMRDKLMQNVPPSEALYILAAGTKRNQFNYFKNGLIKANEKEKEELIRAFVNIVENVANGVYKIIEEKKQRAK